MTASFTHTHTERDKTAPGCFLLCHWAETTPLDTVRGDSPVSSAECKRVMRLYWHRTQGRMGYEQVRGRWVQQRPPIGAPPRERVEGGGSVGAVSGAGGGFIRAELSSSPLNYAQCMEGGGSVASPAGPATRQAHSPHVWGTHGQLGTRDPAAAQAASMVGRRRRDARGSGGRLPALLGKAQVSSCTRGPPPPAPPVMGCCSKGLPAAGTGEETKLP